MAGSWKAAFKKAEEIEAEGAKDFADILAERKKRKREEISGDGEEADDNEVEKESSSGYKQPVQLAQFVSKVAKLGTVDTNEIDQIKEETLKSPVEQPSSAIDGRQICRAWLKNHFLGIGKPCDKSPCPRQHEVTGNPDRLYSDFSFKGLAAKQQKAILAQLKSNKTDK